LSNIKVLKSSLETQKQSLDDEKEGLEKQVAVQTLQRQESAATQAEQNNLLKLTETEYQKQLAEKQNAEKQAQEIRSRIFELIGVPEAPTFGEALEIAKFVSTQTGIRPALLLAVLTQESNIGKNVGQCFLTNFQTGEGVRATSGVAQTKVMAPTRDVPHFLTITSELGRDPKNTPVSCPMKDSYGNPVGWGGAMGPSQFIPSTWVLYKEKLQAIIGKTPDPWNIKDAFLATGVYLKDLGAQTNEFTAVMKYFSGSSWSKWEEFYGRSVLAIAAQYEQDIKEIE
jgi:membrane-bound lytic murein transglycosylase B